MSDNQLEQSTEADVLAAVTDYVYHRHSDLTPTSVIGFNKDDLERLKVENGNLVFSVEHVHVSEKEKNIDDGLTTYYVNATLYFEVDEGEPIEGSTDIYQCYRCGDAWCIEWYAE
jgi:hypothetical protein